MNQAVFERFLVSEDGSTEAELTGAFNILLAPDLLTRKIRPTSRSLGNPRHEDVTATTNGCTASQVVSAKLCRGTRSRPKRTRPAFAGLGLNKSYMVPPTGFEPVLQP